MHIFREKHFQRVRKGCGDDEPTPKLQISEAKVVDREPVNAPPNVSASAHSSFWWYLRSTGTFLTQPDSAFSSAAHTQYAFKRCASRDSSATCECVCVCACVCGYSCSKETSKSCHRFWGPASGLQSCVARRPPKCVDVPFGFLLNQPLKRYPQRNTFAANASVAQLLQPRFAQQSEEPRQVRGEVRQQGPHVEEGAQRA